MEFRRAWSRFVRLLERDWTWFCDVSVDWIILKASDSPVESQKMIPSEDNGLT